MARGRGGSLKDRSTRGSWANTWLSDSDCGAFDHASHAFQSLSDYYYIYIVSDTNVLKDINNTYLPLFPPTAQLPEIGEIFFTI